MNKEQILYILKENESLKLKVKRLEQSTERLQTRYYDAENELNTFKKKYGFLREQFKEIVRQSFPRDYIEKNMKNYSEKELQGFLLSKIHELEDGIFKNSQENKKLLKELSETLSEFERLKNAGPMNFSHEEEYNEDNIEEGTMDKERNNEIGKNAVSIEIPKKTEDNANPVYGVLSLLEEKDWPIIKSIGEGVTLFSNIATELGIANATVNDILTSLEEKGVVNFEKIAKGGRGRPSHHYFLTPLGFKVFEMKYKKQPTTTILEKMSTHGSPAHGGLMVEVGQFLEEIGCEVEYDGPDTTFKLKDGRDIIFDIKAYDPESKEVLLIETERAKSGDKHLQDKFDKCLEFTKLNVSKTVHVISPDKQSLHQVQQQLFRWVRKNNNNLQMLQKNNQDKAIVIFKTATLEDFKNGKLQEFYYGFK